MASGLTWIERRRLRKICKRIVMQGPSHEGNIREYFQIMREAVAAEFTEDNGWTREDFLQRCFIGR